MKFTLVFVWFVFVLSNAIGQVKDTVDGIYTTGFRSLPNYVKNPSCFANNRNISASNTGAVARTTTTPLEGVASCSISGSASGDRVVFDARAMDSALRGQNCEMSFTYQGDASKWKAYVEISSAVASQEVQLENTGLDPVTGDPLSKTVNIPYSCGSLSAPAKPAFEATDSSPLTFKVTSVSVGRLSTIAVDQSRIAGEGYFAGSASCTWSRTSTTLGPFGSNSNCPGPTITTSNMGTWLTTDTDLPKWTVNNLPPGQYRMVVGAGIYQTANSNGTVTVTDGTTTCPEGGNVTASVGDNTVFGCVFNYTAAGNRTFEIYGRNSSSTVNISNSSGTGYSYSTQFTLYYLGSGQVYSATNADTDWASCGHTTSDFTGFGAVTNIETQCKRQGSDLLMRGKFTSGSPSGSEARLNLKFGGSALTSASSSVIPTIQIAGKGNRSDYSTTFFSGLTFLMEPSVAYITFGAESSSVSGQSKLLGTGFSSGQVISMSTIRIPISGWQNSNQIIGTFKETPISPGVDKSVIFGATVNSTCSASPCTISKSYGSTITSINRSGTGAYELVMTGLADAPVCFFTTTEPGSTNEQISCARGSTRSSTSYPFTCKQAGAVINYNFEVYCMGERP